MTDVITQLIAARKAAGFSQRQLAQAIGASQCTISLTERGLTSPRLSTLQLIAEAVGRQVTTTAPAEELTRIIGDVIYEYCDQLGLPPEITRPYGLAEAIIAELRRTEATTEGTTTP